MLTDLRRKVLVAVPCVQVRYRLRVVTPALTTFRTFSRTGG